MYAMTMSCMSGMNCDRKLENLLSRSFALFRMWESEKEKICFAFYFVYLTFASEKKVTFILLFSSILNVL